VPVVVVDTISDADVVVVVAVGSFATVLVVADVVDGGDDVVFEATFVDGGGNDAASGVAGDGDGCDDDGVGDAFFSILSAF
jgi:hypothetical protein